MAFPLGAPREKALELGGGGGYVKCGPQCPEGQWRLGSHWPVQAGVTCGRGLPGPPGLEGRLLGDPLAYPLRAATGSQLSGPQVHCTSSRGRRHHGLVAPLGSQPGFLFALLTATQRVSGSPGREGVDLQALGRSQKLLPGLLRREWGERAEHGPASVHPGLSLQVTRAYQ